MPGEGGGGWGVSLPGGSPCLGGLLARRALPNQGVSLPGGSPFPGGLLARRALPNQGVSLLGGVLPAGDPPVDRITDACKNITLAQLR